MPTSPTEKTSPSAAGLTCHWWTKLGATRVTASTSKPSSALMAKVVRTAAHWKGLMGELERRTRGSDIRDADPVFAVVLLMLANRQLALEQSGGSTGQTKQRQPGP